MEESPFFIVGSGRSGTTILRLMINMHSRLRVPRESWFLMPLLDQLPLTRPLADEEKEHAYVLISTHSRWKDWECKDEVLRAAIFSGGVTDLASLVNQVFIDCSGLRDKVRWADKTPKYSYYVTKLHEVFPSAKFIHLFRDARDTCVSMRNGGWCEGDIQRIARQWTGMTLAARQGQALGPEQYLEISYESLVTEPEKSLRLICDFLNESYEPAMLDFYRTAAKETAPWEDKLHVKTRNPVGVANIDTWRKELSRWELWVVESYASATMKALGQKAALHPTTAPLRWILRFALETKLRLGLFWQKVKRRMAVLSFREQEAN